MISNNDSLHTTVCYSCHGQRRSSKAGYHSYIRHKQKKQQPIKP